MSLTGNQKLSNELTFELKDVFVSIQLQWRPSYMFLSSISELKHSQQNIAVRFISDGAE